MRFLKSNGICIERFRVENGCAIDREGSEKVEMNGCNRIVCTMCPFSYHNVTDFNLHFFFEHYPWQLYEETFQFEKSRGACLERFKVENGCITDQKGLEQVTIDGGQISCSQCDLKFWEILKFNLHFYDNHSEWEIVEKPIPIENLAIVDNVDESSFAII